jgi:uncharacterized membrane protein YfcA
MLLLGSFLALLVGVTLGLLGGGGSILTLPMLVYVLHLAPKPAIAASLVVVGTTALTGMIAHARAGRVAVRAGAVFGLAGMAGAYAGGRIGVLVPGQALLAGFGVVMLVTALAMLRGRRAPEPRTKQALSIPKAVAIGALVGAVAGLVGAGGGFLIVPALVLAGGLSMPEAIGTSLLVIAMQSFAGLLGYVGHVTLDVPLVTVVTVASVIGSLLGARLARRVSPAALRQAFAWLVLAMALFMLGKQLYAAAWPSPAVLGAAGAVAVLAIGLARRSGGRGSRGALPVAPAPDHR